MNITAVHVSLSNATNRVISQIHIQALGKFLSSETLRQSNKQLTMPPTPGSGNIASSESVTGNAPPASDSLQYYMNHVYSNRIEPMYGPHLYFSARPSNGLLDRDRVNRVLLFGGCFDPPHIAHLKLLEYVYTQAHTRLNIVGAIIIPWSKHSCNTVARNRKNPAIWNNERAPERRTRNPFPASGENEDVV